MLKIVDPDINNYICKTIDEKFISMPGLVIAGGFATAMYMQSLAPVYHTCNMWEKHVDFFYAYSDIDFWALENSKASHFINDLNSYPQTDLSSKESFLYNKFDSQPKIIERTDELGYSLPARRSLEVKISDMACTLKFYKDKLDYPRPYQIITKRDYKSIDSLLDTFDLDICKVAWYQGVFYVSDDFLSAYKSKVISTKMEFSEFSYGSLVTASRALKYSVRFQEFTLSEDLLDHVCETASTALKVISDFQKSSETFLSDFPNFGAVETTEPLLPYMSGGMSILTACSQLANNFGLILQQKNFSKSKAIYMFTDNPHASYQLQQYLDNYNNI